MKPYIIYPDQFFNMFITFSDQLRKCRLHIQGVPKKRIRKLSYCYRVNFWPIWAFEEAISIYLNSAFQCHLRNWHTLNSISNILEKWKRCTVRKKSKWKKLQNLTVFTHGALKSLKINVQTILRCLFVRHSRSFQMNISNSP